MFFNIVVATGTLDGGEYREMQYYRGMLRSLMYSMDFPAQQIPHREFFVGAGITQDHAVLYPMLIVDPDKLVPAVHGDLGCLKAYLKVLFKLIYRYDVVMRECGVDPELDGEVVYTVAELAKGIKVKVEWLENDNGSCLRREFG